MTSGRRSRWYSSFCWRIGVSFVVLVIVVLVAQSVMYSYLLTRSASGFKPPNAIATTIAAQAGAEIARGRLANLQAVLDRDRDALFGVYIVMKDGSVFAETDKPLPEDVRRDVDAVLRGAAADTSTAAMTMGPVVTAPIQVAGELRGIVVMPPPTRGMLQEIGRFLSLPGTVILVAATALAALVIFAPARRRLQALERAAERFGRGDLAVRAPEGGRDEIARVASAFNRMAAELGARDDALRTSDRLRRQMFADVSHEPKTPLTATIGYLDTLQMPEIHVDDAARTLPRNRHAGDTAARSDRERPARPRPLRERRGRTERPRVCRRACVRRRDQATRTGSAAAEHRD